MQECFDKKDIGMLQDLVAKMDKKEAEYHIRRCVDSGLWVPNAADNPTASASGDAQEEEVYEDALDK